MGEKIFFKVKTHKFITVIALLTVLFLIITCGIFTVNLTSNLKYEEEYLRNHKHTPECFSYVVYEDYLAEQHKYSSFQEFVEIINKEDPDALWEASELCGTLLVEGSVEKAIEYRYDANLGEFAEQIVSCLVLSLIPLILILLLKIKRSKFVVTESKIYGKKGYKKFDIAFCDIIELTKQGENLNIKTEDKELKLSSLKQCNEIYNHIKPCAPEQAVTQQPSVDVNADDIKLF